MKPISYLQTDSKWKNKPYGSSTVGKAGCGPTAMAMVVSTLKKTVLPDAACKWAKSKGYYADGQGTYYSFFKAYGKEYGIGVEQINWTNLRNASASTAKPYHDKAKKALQNGDWVIACMGPGLWTSGGHFILVYDLTGSSVLIRDPNSTASNRVKNTLSKLQSEVKYYFIVTVDKKTTTTTTKKLGKIVDIKDYKVETTGKLNVRSNAGTEYKITKKALNKGAVVTVTHQRTAMNGKLWGKLKGGGWISLAYTKKYVAPKVAKPKAGNTVTINGIYVSTGSTVRKTPLYKTAKVDKVLSGKNPYRLKKGKSIIGYARLSNITKVK